MCLLITILTSGLMDESTLRESALLNVRMLILGRFIEDKNSNGAVETQVWIAVSGYVLVAIVSRHRSPLLYRFRRSL